MNPGLSTGDTEPGRFADWLGQRLRTLSIDSSELATRAGFNRSTVSRWLTGTSRPGPARLSPLAQTLNVPVSLLLDAAGYPVDLGDLSALSSDELELIANYRRLSPAQQSMLQAAARAGV